jgi:Holliday junction DNA helicase RuvA
MYFYLLYSSESERDAFLLLSSVSGIGGKTSLGILSSINVESLSNFIVNQNLSALQKLPGIGKKTAERLCFELKDKINSIKYTGSDLVVQNNDKIIINEAISALVALGYSKNVAEKAVKSAQSTLKGEIKIESLIKVALKYTMN